MSKITHYVTVTIMIVAFFSGCAKTAEEKQIKEENNETILRVEGIVRPIDEAKILTINDGEILSVLKRNGDRVHKGDVIAVYDKKSILIDIERIQEKIRAKKRALGYFQKNGSMQENEAVVNNAKLQLQKIAQLYHLGAASKIEFDNAEDRYLTLLASGKAQHVTELEREKSHADETGDLEEYYGQLAQLKNTLQHTNIVAGTDGFLTNFKLQAGEQVVRSTEIGQIVNIDHVVVYGALAAGLYPFVKEGKKVTISFMTTPQIQRTGIIDRIIPVVDPELGRMIFQIPLDNPDYSLQPSTKGLIQVALSKADQGKVRKTYYEADKRSKYIDIPGGISGNYSKYQKY